MADVNQDAIKALTGFDRNNPTPLPTSEVELILEIPGAADMVAAHEFLKKHDKQDLKMCVYIFRFHTLFPNFKDMNDIDLEKVVDDMGYKDVATVILSFFGMDLNKKEDQETIETVFRELEREETLSTLPESLISP